MKKLDQKTYRLRRIFDYLGVASLILLLLFIWQLYRGEVMVPFLKPYIIKALNHDNTEYQVSLDSVNLELVRSLRPLRIIANNVTYRKSDDSLIINAPKTSVSFSIRALLNGIIAPGSIDVYNPQVHIFTNYGVSNDKKDEINQKKIEYYFDVFNNFLERFNSEDLTYPESFINSINIVGAELELHEVDLGKKWRFSDVNYHFERGFGKIETSIDSLFNFKQTSSSLGFDVVYRNGSGKLAAKFYFSDLVPANLVALLTSQDWKDNYKVDVPINGSIETMIDLNNVVEYRKDLPNHVEDLINTINFSIEGGHGKIAFSDKEEDNFNIGSIMLNGEISGDLEKLSIKEARLELDGQEALLGVDIGGVKNYFLKSSPNDLRITINAHVKKLPTNDLFNYWPKYIGTVAWNWCKDSMFDGYISDASFKFDFGYDKQQKKIVYKGLRGEATADGVSLKYLNEMPKVTDIYGKVYFYPDKLHMVFDKGVSDNVILESGEIELYDLDKDNNYAHIKLFGVGEISDILRLIDNPPLGYTSEMGIDPSIIKGSAQANLDLNFELKKNLTPQEVKVEVSAKLQDIVINKLVNNKKIEAKNLDLLVNNQGLKVNGVANYDGLPISIMWNENFMAKDYQSRYQLGFNFDNNFKQKMGLDYSILGNDYIQGSIPAQATITKYSDNNIIADINGDLQKSDIDYSFLGFKKKSGTEGVITARLDVSGGKLKDVPEFSLSKPNFNIKGRIKISDSGGVKLIDIYDIKGPKTSAQAKIDMGENTGDKIKINVSGHSYNLSDFFAKDEDDIKKSKAKRQLKKEQESNNESAEENEWKASNDTDINIAVGKLWTNENIAIHNFAGSAKILKGVGINEMRLIGNFAPYSKKSKPTNLKLEYIPRANNEYLLNIESNDAGSTLKFLRIYDNMKGGRLSINAKRDANKNFIGHAKVRDFNLHNTPVLAKLLTVASLSGMVDLLTGDGIAFSHFDAPFEYKDSVLKVQDAKAFGNVLGISGSGIYISKFQEFDIKGLIAPAYGLNTFIGKIPLVGNLLSGKDGTVFAANYYITGNIDEPNININPLSALSPNSLKELFSSIFGND